MSLNLNQLSKVVSHALRHEPHCYNLKLDIDGWVNLSDLILSLKDKDFPNIKEEDIILMIEQAQKKRHEIINGKIRACYGHSLDGKIYKQVECPPVILYHGTISSNLKSILDKGLLPMNRQYVHLSMDKQTAKNVANRKKEEICILTVMAREAFGDGVFFYKEDSGIWLSEQILPKYIKL